MSLSRSRVVNSTRKATLRKASVTKAPCTYEFYNSYICMCLKLNRLLRTLPRLPLCHIYLLPMVWDAFWDRCYNT